MPTRREGNIVQHLQSMEEGLALAEPDFGFNTSFQSEIICKRLREDAPRPPAEKGSNNARSGFPFLIMLNVDPFTIVTVTIL